MHNGRADPASCSSCSSGEARTHRRCSDRSEIPRRRDADRVTLDVGDELFTTTRDTLTRGSHYFEGLLAGDDQPVEAAFVDRMRGFEAAHGGHFAPAPIIVDAAKNGTKFHP